MSFTRREDWRKFLRWWQEHTADIAPEWWFHDSRAPVPAWGVRTLLPDAAATYLVYLGIKRRQLFRIKSNILTDSEHQHKFSGLLKRNYFPKVSQSRPQAGTSQDFNFFRDTYPILPCSVRSPSLWRIAVSILRVELPDLLWLFFTPSSHLTINFMPWIWGMKGQS